MSAQTPGGYPPWGSEKGQNVTFLGGYPQKVSKLTKNGPKMGVRGGPGGVQILMIAYLNGVRTGFWGVPPRKGVPDP